jgi:Xaa-Pro dipeptidase
MHVEKIQKSLRKANLGGWLFFDHHRRDHLAYRILNLPEDVETTRRWYYFIPADGEPQKLVHRIENNVLDSLPGTKQAYASWADQYSRLGCILLGTGRVAMQYSPKCSIPYVSLVDAGTVELIRSFGVEVVTSADLVQEYEARLTAEQIASHMSAGEKVDRIRREAFDLIGQRLHSNEQVTEFEIQQFIQLRFSQSNLVTTHGPIVAKNEHASNPHYEPLRETPSHINSGDLILIDLWAKLDRPGSVFYDVTWTGYCGEHIPDQMNNVFEVVREARKRACDFVVQRISSGELTAGYQVDDVARGYIEGRGFGEFFFHRTGHSIGTDVHGTGANMDNLESHDVRLLSSGSCFSIEPGIYLPEFGIRSEVNIVIDGNSAKVTGEEQERLLRI